MSLRRDIQARTRQPQHVKPLVENEQKRGNVKENAIPRRRKRPDAEGNVRKENAEVMGTSVSKLAGEVEHYKQQLKLSAARHQEKDEIIAVLQAEVEAKDAMLAQITADLATAISRSSEKETMLQDVMSQSKDETATLRAHVSALEIALVKHGIDPVTLTEVTVDVSADVMMRNFEEKLFVLKTKLSTKKSELQVNLERALTTADTNKRTIPLSTVPLRAIEGPPAAPDEDEEEEADVKSDGREDGVVETIIGSAPTSPERHVLTERQPTSSLR